MNKRRKNFLLKQLKKHLARLENDVDRAKKALQYLSGEAPGSWSIAGERKQAETDLKLIIDLFKKTQKLYREIASCQETRTIKIAPPCHVTIGFEDKKGESKFYFLETSSQIPDIAVISPSSPLGKVILNKRVGDKFSYKTEVAVVGKIKEIE